MGTTPQLNFARKFDLDAGSGILSPASAGAVEVALSTDADIVEAIRTNGAFPDRPNGRIELGRIALKADADRDILFQSGATSVAFKASASAFAGAGVFDSGPDAVGALGLKEAPGIDLALAGTPHRYMVLRAGYEAAGAASGKHPIGALGTVTFGVEGKHDALFAVLHRFPSTQGSHDVIRKAISSWRMPRQVTDAAQLAPGTWLVAETEGQVAVNLAAQLGYDFTFVRDLKSIGLSGDVGFKIDAAAKATLGFEVSGKYLVVLGREDSSQVLRLRLFKQAKKGHSFGLNLAVGVKGITEALPEGVDDLVKSIFGVHGRQVVKDLLAIEQWTDPSKDLSDTVAGLVRKTGFDLLRRTTGIDPETAFNEARDRLLSHLRVWDRLPDNVAAGTWRALEQVSDSGPGFDQFRAAVASLADPDEKRRGKALAALIAEAAAPHVPEIPGVGRVRTEWITAIAERGLLALLGRADEVHQSAVAVQQVLDGGVVRKLQAFINDRLDLDKVRNATDFAQIDAWMVQRLSQFIDERFDTTRLNEVRTLINTVVKKRQEVYAAAKKALSQRYSASIAAAYSSTTASTALIDVEFDLAQEAAKELFINVVAESRLDDLLTVQTPGVSLREAMLSHGVERRSSIEVTLPQYNSRRDHIQKMLATVRASEEGGRVLLYQLDASDTVTVRNKLRSELAVGAALPVAAAQNLRVRSTDKLSWSYRYVAVQPRLRRAALESQVAPFIAKYMPDQFPQGGASSFDTWITDFDRAVEGILNNGTNEFGDTILDMQVSAPGAALAAWFRERSSSQVERDSMEMSRRIQSALKQLIPFYYLRNPDQLRQNPTVAALLTWQAMPVSTSVHVADGRLTLDTGKDVFWNHVDRATRHAMVQNPITASNLGAILAGARKMLLEAGQAKEARMFEPSEAADFQSMTLSGMGETLLSQLLTFESTVVHQAAEALKDVAGFVESARTSPSQAIERLADMGGDITDAFHGKLSSVYGGDAVRSLGSLVFLEATCALDPSLRASRPDALLRIIVVKPEAGFPLTDYLRGVEPPREAVALAQTLAALGA